jgi:hypothetical protein
MDEDLSTPAHNPAPDSDAAARDWVSSKDWRTYEAYVTGALQRRFPGAAIHPNVRRRGLKSGVMRQIDVFADVADPVAIDCKCYGRKVDVKHVEAFLGMLDDLGVHAGILVTTKGYSPGALARAANDSRNIELQILSPDRLSTFQHVGSPIIWLGTHGVSLSTPEGFCVRAPRFRLHLPALISYNPDYSNPLLAESQTKRVRNCWPSRSPAASMLWPRPGAVWVATSKPRAVSAVSAFSNAMKGTIGSASP